MNVKVKWMIAAIAILFLMNAATLGTILYHSKKQEASFDGTVIASSFPVNTVNGKYFRQTLGFSDEQMNIFRKANQQFRPQTMALTLAIDSLKAEMFKEMKRLPTDTLHLNALSAKIGELHGSLKQATYRFYLTISATCSNQQRAELDKVFEPLFINEKLQFIPGGRQRVGKKETIKS